MQPYLEYFSENSPAILIDVSAASPETLEREIATGRPRCCAKRARGHRFRR
jgi:hypothetical protein